MASLTWIGGSGNWSVATDWDLGRLPGTADEVVFDGNNVMLGTGMVVTLDVPASIMSLSLDGFFSYFIGTGTVPVLDVADVLAVSATLNVGSAVLDFRTDDALDGGTLFLTSVSPFPIGGPLPLVIPAPSEIDVDGTLTFGAGETVADRSNQAVIEGDGVVINNGTMLIPDIGSPFLFPGGRLDLAVRAFTNTGTVDIGAQGMLTLGAVQGVTTPMSFRNAGVIDVAASGILSSASQTSFANTGTIVLANNASLVAWLAVDLAGVPGGLGTVVNSGGRITLGLNGTLDNTGSIFDFAQANAASVDGFAGLLIGGTILPDGGNLLFEDGTLDGVTYAGPLNAVGGSTIDVTNGLSVTAPSGSTSVIDLSGYFAAPGFGAVGQATLRMEGDAALDDMVIRAGTVITTGTLTLGPQALLLDSFGIMSLAATNPSGEIINDGTVHLGDNAKFQAMQISAPTFSNGGSIIIGAGDWLNLNVPTLVGGGTIILENGATLSDVIHATLAQLETAQGSIVNAGGSIDLRLVGTIENAGTVFDAATANSLNVTGFGNGFRQRGTMYPAVLHGGTLITDDGSLTFNSTTLDAVHVEGALQIGQADIVYIHDGFDVTGSVVFNNADYGEGGFGGWLVATNTESFDNATIEVAENGTIADWAGLTLGAHLRTNIDPGGRLNFYPFLSMTNFGTIAAAPASAGVTIASDGSLATFVNDGLINLGADDALIDHDVPFEGTGVVVAQGNDVLLFGSSVAAGQTVELSGTGNLVIAGASSVFDATIAGFAAGDTIDLADLAFSAGATLSYGGGVLSVISGGTTAATLSLPGSYQTANFSLNDDGSGGSSLTVTCFVAGTRIGTAIGSMAVERLRVGDVVRTLAGMRPVIWIGHRHIDCERHPDPKRVWPVEIAAHAFGRGRPGRTLRLSPDHAVFADDVLIPVKYLINGMTITQVPVNEVTYHHLELSRHEILWAEGLPVESYLDTGSRANFANGGAAMTLHPDFAARAWDADGCAPLVATGAEFDALRERLDCRARWMRGEVGATRRWYGRARRG